MSKKIQLKDKSVEVGQSVWVTSLPGWGVKESHNLGEFIVSKVNGSSFYAYPVGKEEFSHRRFSRRNWVFATGWGEHWAAYETPTQYAEIQQRHKEKEQLLSKIQAKCATLNRAQLERLEKYIDMLKEAKR